MPNLGLIIEYKYSAFAHVAPYSLDDGWLAITENAPSSDEIEKFTDYMTKQWPENETIRLMWKCYGERHRITNALECWHSKINKTYGKNHPHVFEVILHLKKVQRLL